jgi:tyrosine decarboxylase / aspartate 1-decarboxylase
LPVQFFEANLHGASIDQERLTCLRSVLMKPEHLDWIGQIWEILSEAADEARKN